MKDVDDTVIRIASEYIRGVLELPEEEYRITHEGVDKETGLNTVNVIHKDDLDPKNAYPGGGCGKSFVLYINLQTGMVEKRLFFQ